MPQIIEVPGHGEVEFPDGMSNAQIEAAIKANVLKQQTPPVGTVADALSSAVDTVAEPLVSAATGTVGQALGGLAGGITSLIPGTKPGSGADVSEAISSALTYQPRSAGAKKVLETAAVPFEWLAKKAKGAGEAVQDATGSPLAATAADTFVQSLPMIAGGLLGRAGAGAESAASIAARAARKSENALKDETIARARAENLRVPPSDLEGSFLTDRIEGIGGKAAVAQKFQLHNQKAGNVVARREAGLDPGATISEATLDAARTKIAAPYREFEQLPPLEPERFTTQLNPMRSPYPLIKDAPPTPSQLMHDWKSTNTTATELWRDYQRNAKVETLDSYKNALQKKADIEALMDKTAQAAGRPDLVQAMQSARVKLAKNYDVERALNLGSGDVDMRVFGRMLDKGIKLTDGLETMGRFANSHSKFVRDAAQVPAPGVSKTEGIASALFGAGGHAALGLPGLALAAVPLVAPPTARALVLSKMMQQPRTYNRGIMGNLGEEAARKATVLGPLQSLLGPSD